MATEIRNALSAIREELVSGRIEEAIARLDALREEVARDRWIDDGPIRETEELLALTARPFSEIAQVFQQGLCAGLAASRAVEDPFPLRTLDQVLPERIFALVAGSVPPMRFFRPRRDAHFLVNGAFQRYELSLTDERLKGAGHTRRKLWLGLRRAVDSPAVRRAVAAAVDSSIPERGGLSLLLMLDRSGFAMAPHTDGSDGALVTFHIYLPQRDVGEDAGTEFFRRAGEGFELRLKRPYRPNTGHLFRVTPDSWHGLVTPIPPLAEGRGSLVLRYFPT